MIHPCNHFMTTSGKLFNALTAWPFSSTALHQSKRPTVAPAGGLLQRRCTITLQLLTDKYTCEWRTWQHINWRDNSAVAVNVLSSSLTDPVSLTLAWLNWTRLVQPVATYRQSPYLHKPAIVIVTSLSLLTSRAYGACGRRSRHSQPPFSLWRRSLMSWPHPALRTTVWTPYRVEYIEITWPR